MLNAEINAIKFVIKAPISGITEVNPERSERSKKYGCPIIKYIIKYSNISINIIR